MLINLVSDSIKFVNMGYILIILKDIDDYNILV